MEDVPENDKESSHSAHADGMNELQCNAKTHDITTLGLKITSNFYFLRKIQPTSIASITQRQSICMHESHLRQNLQ
jgi:hypothetical protein